jgi:hypothetical protein
LPKGVYEQIFTAVRRKNELRVKRKVSFPIRVKKNGVTVPVYRVRSGNGYISYVISYRENCKVNGVICLERRSNPLCLFDLNDSNEPAQCPNEP